jgi:hypothetical protein
VGQGNGAASHHPPYGREQRLTRCLISQPFEEIATLTDVAEGTIVRVITRLDETCREVRDAARVIGDADLMKKMEEAQGKIRRDSQYRPFLSIATALTGLGHSRLRGELVFLNSVTMQSVVI